MGGSLNRRRRLRKNEQRREVERRASSQARAEREAETCSAKSSYSSNAEALRAAELELDGAALHVLRAGRQPVAETGGGRRADRHDVGVERDRR